MKVTEKRYQYFGTNGIAWTKWFQSSESDEKWQIKNKLKNEYRTVERTDFTPEEIAELAVKHQLCEEADKKKLIRHLSKHVTSLYTINDGESVDTSHVMGMLCSSKYVKEADKETFVEALKKK